MCDSKDFLGGASNGADETGSVLDFSATEGALLKYAESKEVLDSLRSALRVDGSGAGFSLNNH